MEAREGAGVGYQFKRSRKEEKVVYFQCLGEEVYRDTYNCC